jgi:hypothetical protein
MRKDEGIGGVRASSGQGAAVKRYWWIAGILLVIVGATKNGPQEQSYGVFLRPVDQAAIGDARGGREPFHNRGGRVASSSG